MGICMISFGPSSIGDSLVTSSPTERGIARPVEYDPLSEDGITPLRYGITKAEQGHQLAIRMMMLVIIDLDECIIMPPAPLLFSSLAYFLCVINNNKTKRSQ